MVADSGPVGRRRFWGRTIAFWTSIGLLMFCYKFLDVFVRGHTEPMHDKLIEELTGTMGAALLTPYAFRVARRVRSGVWPWAAHLPAVVLFSALHTTWNWGSRLVAFQTLGYGRYDYGRMALRYAMEFPSDVIIYVLMGVFIVMVDAQRAARDRDVRLAALEAEVARVRLEALESQLQPHFLFNALNTVSAMMFEDVERADRMMTRLADLLRRTLDGGGEVPLRHELDTLALYVDLLRERFGERLVVRIDADDAVLGATVPHLALQLLVENAVKHGDPGPGRAAHIDVAARRDGDALVLRVADDGPGLRGTLDEAMRRGIGLANTARRLQRLHGEAASLASEPDGAGCAMVIRMPYRG